MSKVGAGHPHRLLTLAALVVVSIGIALGKVVVVPVVLTVFIVIVTAPLYHGLKQWGLPPWVARVVVMACVLVGLVGLFAIGAAVLRGLFDRLPLYEAQYGAFRSAFNAYIHQHPSLSNALTGLVPAPNDLIGMMDRGLHTLLSYVWPAWLLVFLVQDALEDADTLPKAVRELLPSGPRLWANWHVSAGFVRRYMGVRALEGGVKAAVVFGLLQVLHVDFPLAWALLAFLSTFLPQSIGQPLALIGPAFMAMIGPGAWATAVFLVAYPLLEWACDELFEPYLDRTVQMSDFQAGVAVFYWTLVLGPLGAFLAVPLTVMVRAFLASFEESWPAAVLMVKESEPPQRDPAHR